MPSQLARIFRSAGYAAEINGTIPRLGDIGDARLTTYFYTFGGDQGDLFLNVVSKNFTGDIDVFTAAGLRPVTKIMIYAAEGDNKRAAPSIFGRQRNCCFELGKVAER